MDELAVHIGSRIKAARNRLKLSQGRLAELVEVSLRGVQQWESGERRCSLEKLHRVANALRTTPAHLLGDSPAESAGLSIFCDSVGYGVEGPLATRDDAPVTRADIAGLEAKLDALTRLLEERLPPRA